MPLLRCCDEFDELLPPVVSRAVFLMVAIEPLVKRIVDDFAMKRVVPVVRVKHYVFLRG